MIPVLDLAKVTEAKNKSHDLQIAAEQELASRMRSALSKIGFVHLINHGVNEDMGYVGPGREIFDQNESGIKASHEIRESFDVTSIEHDALFPDTEVPELRSALTELANETLTLGKSILRIIALSLDQEPDSFLDCHSRILKGKNWSKIRSLYYPPMPDNDDDILEGSIRCGEHSDYGTITFLYQDSMGGLEVRSVDGSWTKAEPLSGAILVNVGDLLEKFSAGMYPATLHRVVVPKEEMLRKNSRQSIVFFFHPDFETTVQPLVETDGSVVREKTLNLRPISAHDHVVKRFAETFQY